MQPSIDVYFTPPAPAAVSGKTLAVIDTLRATTVITTLISGGAARIYPVASHDLARTLAASMPGALLCGESNGERPPGFDHGNSPTHFAALDVRGWTVVQSTSNGTRALALASVADRALVGCLRNRAALVDQLAGAAADLVIVCSGEADGQRPSVEDSFTAGAIVDHLLAQPSWTDGVTELTSGARLALRIFHAYDADPARAFADSPHADHVRRLGDEQDLAFAAQLDAEHVVPVAGLDVAGRVIVALNDAAIRTDQSSA